MLRPFDFLFSAVVASSTGFDSGVTSESDLASACSSFLGSSFFLPNELKIDFLLTIFAGSLVSVCCAGAAGVVVASGPGVSTDASGVAAGSEKGSVFKDIRGVKKKE